MHTPLSLSQTTEKIDQKVDQVKEKLDKVLANFNSLLNDSFPQIQSCYSDYLSKIKKESKDRIKSINISNDYDKASLLSESLKSLDDLVIKNEEYFTSLKNLIENYKQYLSKEVIVFGIKSEKQNFKISKFDNTGFENVNANSGNKNNENKLHRLEVKSSDGIGQAKNVIDSSGEVVIEKFKAKKLNDEDIKHLFSLTGKKNSYDTNYGNGGYYLNKREINKITLKKCTVKDIKFCEAFSNLSCFKLENCKISYEINEKLNFYNLTKLVLDGVGLVSENFNSLLMYLLKSDKEKNNEFIGRNLKILSARNNLISRIKIKNDLGDEQTKVNCFQNLDILNLANNNISQFPEGKIGNNLDPFSTIKFLDLTNNNITIPKNVFQLKRRMDKGCLIILSKNAGIMNKKFRNQYCKDLVTKLQEYDNKKIKIKSFNFEGLFGQENISLFNSMNISNFSNSLIELNLSFCNIDDNRLINLLKVGGNMHLPNLKKLILCSNSLTDKILELFIQNNFHETYLKLKKLDLSCNPINFDKADKYKNFFKNFSQINTIILKNTIASEDINLYMKMKIIRFFEAKKKIKSKPLNEKDKEIQKLIDQDHYLRKNTNVTIVLSDIIRSKYTGLIKKIYPDLLERIELDNQFPDEK